MRYVGSKNRISKYLVPVIQNCINGNCKGYIEPFVGGANIIDKIKQNRTIPIEEMKNYLYKKGIKSL